MRNITTTEAMLEDGSDVLTVTTNRFNDAANSIDNYVGGWLTAIVIRYQNVRIIRGEAGDVRTYMAMQESDCVGYIIIKGVQRGDCI